MSDSLWPNELQHTRIPCPSPSPRVCSNSHPSSQWCYPTISSFVAPFFLLSSIFPSIGVFPKESVLHIRGLKYRSFSFSTSPSNEYSGWISFRIDCLDLVAIQETLKSLLQHHNSKVSILWRSTIFMVQLTSIYNYWKTIPLIIQTFVSKVMSLLFNMLPRFVLLFQWASAF